MTDLLTGGDFSDLFETFEHTAFRLELRDRYAMPDEQERLRRFLAGEGYDESDRRRSPWLDTMRRATAAGKKVERVRVVTEPHSAYVRYLIAGTHLNTEAGEDIRWLPRHRAASLHLPGHDYWLFDSRRVARLHFDQDDRLLGAEIVTDPAVVVEHCAWRDVAWHYAIPHESYKR